MRVQITLPVYNEEKLIESTVSDLISFLLRTKFRHPWEITIVDNGSTDNTLEVAKMLQDRYPRVTCIHLNQKGRGRALKKAWGSGDADIYSYMDIDLSTDLNDFPKLINAVAGGYDIAIGSRLMDDSRTTRCFKREVLSRGYNTLLNMFFGVGFIDAQCGFKAVNRWIVEDVVPLVENNEWFFDTELLVRSEWMGFTIKEIPVVWREDMDSRVDVPKVVYDYLMMIYKLRGRL